MTEPKVNVEWKRAVDFAEVAEALDVPTTQIMAVTPATLSDGLLVAFNEDVNDETLSVAVLQRGVDDVLFVSVAPEKRPGLWESIIAEDER